MTRCHRCEVIRSKVSNATRPALVTRISVGPRVERISTKAASRAGRSVTSTTRPSAADPSACRSLATRCAPSPSRSSTATRWPRPARWWLVASPMPDAPPVTTATRDCCALLGGIISCSSLVGDFDDRGRRHGLAREHPALGDLVGGERLVVPHHGVSPRDSRHAGGAGSRLARRGGPQADGPRRLQERAATTVRGADRLPPEPDDHRAAVRRGGFWRLPGRGEPLDVHHRLIHPQVAQPRFDSLHEAARPADVVRGVAGVAGYAGHLVSVDEATGEILVVV